MTCQKIQDNLSAYIDGELSERAGAAIEKHLSRCDACLAVYRELAKVQDLVTNLPKFAPPNETSEELQRYVEREMLIDNITPSRGRSWQKVAVSAGVALAACLVVLVTVIYSIRLNNNTPSLQPPTPQAQSTDTKDDMQAGTAIARAPSSEDIPSAGTQDARELDSDSSDTLSAPMTLAMKEKQKESGYYQNFPTITREEKEAQEAPQTHGDEAFAMGAPLRETTARAAPIETPAEAAPSGSAGTTEETQPDFATETPVSSRVLGGPVEPGDISEKSTTSPDLADSAIQLTEREALANGTKAAGIAPPADETTVTSKPYAGIADGKDIASIDALSARAQAGAEVEMDTKAYAEGEAARKKLDETAEALSEEKTPLDEDLDKRDIWQATQEQRLVALRRQESAAGRENAAVEETATSDEETAQRSLLASAATQETPYEFIVSQLTALSKGSRGEGQVVSVNNRLLLVNVIKQDISVQSDFPFTVTQEVTKAVEEYNYPRELVPASNQIRPTVYSVQNYRIAEDEPVNVFLDSQTYSSFFDSLKNRLTAIDEGVKLVGVEYDRSQLKKDEENLFDVTITVEPLQNASSDKETDE